MLGLLGALEVLPLGSLGALGRFAMVQLLLVSWWVLALLMMEWLEVLGPLELLEVVQLVLVAAGLLAHFGQDVPGFADMPGRIEVVQL